MKKHKKKNKIGKEIGNGERERAKTKGSGREKEEGGSGKEIYRRIEKETQRFLQVNQISKII